ncbi:hypothetical protein [Phenylobacterium sp.]|uniref:hypothetical protein n=1 Tax=Phenylobacterium sp. TaxID=1871053 RepID=UPI00394949F7
MNLMPQVALRPTEDGRLEVKVAGTPEQLAFAFNPVFAKSLFVTVMVQAALLDEMSEPETDTRQ